MSTKVNKPVLLVPVDFKMYCLKAIDYAKNLRQKMNAKIHLVHVIESQSWWGSYFSVDKLTAAAEEKVQGLIKEQGLGDDTEYTVSKGKSHSEIVILAEKLDARYIILSDNYPLTKAETVIGSTLSQVLIKATHPVISITDKQQSIFKNVLVPIDLSKTSRLQQYKSVAMAMAYGSKIHLVSVLFGYETKDSSTIHDKIEKYRTVYDENGIDYEIALLRKEQKYAYREVIKYSEQNNIDTILMMAHSETASFSNYLGAFAQHVINEATVPVITMNSVSAKETSLPQFKEILDPLGILKIK